MTKRRKGFVNPDQRSLFDLLVEEREQRTVSKTGRMNVAAPLQAAIREANRDEKDRDLQSWRTARHLDLPVFPTVSCKGLSSDRIRWHNPEAIQSERQALSILGVQV